MNTKETMTLEFTTKGVTESKAKIDNLNSSLSNMASKIGLVTVAYAGMKAAISTIDAASKFESLEMRLTNLYQSAAKASDVFEKFKKVAVDTPYELTNIVEAGAQLKAFGMDAEKTLMSITDLAAYMGLDVVEAANSVGRAFAGGVGAADILRERGVLTLIRDFNKIDDLTKLTLPQFREAMLRTFVDPSAGIAGAGKRMMDTYEGAISNLKDSFTVFKAEIGKSFLPGIDIAVRGLTKFITLLKDSYAGYRQLIFGMEEQNIAALTFQYNELTKAFEDGSKSRYKSGKLAGAAYIALTRDGEKYLELDKKITEAKKRQLEIDTANAKLTVTNTPSLDKLTKLNLPKVNTYLGEVRSNVKLTTFEFEKFAASLDQMQGQELNNIGDAEVAYQRAMEVFAATSYGGADLINAAFSSLSNSFADLIPRFKQSSDAVTNIFRNLANDVIAELNRIIAKEVITFAWKTILNTAGFAVTGGGSGLFDVIGGLFRGTTGGGGASTNVNPIGERSLDRQFSALAGQINNRPMTVYALFDAKDVSKAAEKGKALRYVLGS